MKEKTKIKLQVALETCDNEERSTEYTIQFMMDFAKVSFDCVMNYLYKNRDKEKD